MTPDEMQAEIERLRDALPGRDEDEAAAWRRVVEALRKSHDARDHAIETLRQLIVLLADAKPVVATAEFAFGLVEKHLRERHPGLLGGDDE